MKRLARESLTLDFVNFLLSLFGVEPRLWEHELYDLLHLLVGFVFVLEDLESDLLNDNRLAKSPFYGIRSITYTQSASCANSGVSQSFIYQSPRGSKRPCIGQCLASTEK